MTSILLAACYVFLSTSHRQRMSLAGNRAFWRKPRKAPSFPQSVFTKLKQYMEISNTVANHKPN